MDHSSPAATITNTAGDAMTAHVLSVAPDTTVQAVAALLLHHRISAVPVLDGLGVPVGMVSEGDLLGRRSSGHLTGRAWWLAILEKPGQSEAAVIEAARGSLVRDVMHAPVVTVDAGMPVAEVARLLREEAIKRVPVMRGGQMVGIVSRADLLRAMEGGAPPAEASGLGAMIASFFGGTGGTSKPAAHAAAAAAAPPAAAQSVTAVAFRALVDASNQGKVDEVRAEAHAAELERKRQVKAMLAEHVDSEMWSVLMNHAGVAAAHGEQEMELLRFPSDMCSDGGRTINNRLEGWPETLRGEAAEMYARWERDLRPAGFRLVARVVEYTPGGLGQVALVLVWGE